MGWRGFSARSDSDSPVAVGHCRCFNGEMSSAHSPLAEVNRVVRTFDRDSTPVRALRDASLSVARGEFVAVVGPSGSGKSTLLSLLAGLDTPDEGTVTVLGHDIAAMSDDGRAVFRRTHIGMVFQFFRLLETMSAADNIAIACRLNGMHRRAAARRAADLLDLLGLGGRDTTQVSALSGGQRQRLAIARAIANSPGLLLADEPTGALDSDGGGEILELFRLLHDQGQTIVMVTHDPSIAAVADKVVTLRDGKTTAQTRRTDALTDPPAPPIGAVP